MNLKIKCSGCNKPTNSDKLESFDGSSKDGIFFKKQLCPKCVKEIMNQFRAHIKEKEEHIKKQQEILSNPVLKIDENVSCETQFSKLELQ
jgi:hypothetical protein